MTITSPQRPQPPLSAAPIGVQLLIFAILSAGFALSIAVFYPGYMTIDALWVYEAITRGLGDWQSPVMSVLWSWIDPIAPGSMSMFLLMALLYWSGFGLVALTVARRSAWLGVATAVLALAPPAFFFIGLIWRDILMADAWMLAAALAYAASGKRAVPRWPLQVLALVLVAFSVLLRPNAIIAAPLLATYVLWPASFSWKRAAVILMPGIVAGYALIHIVYYNVLGVERQNSMHSLLVFDLGGISYFTGENRFPVTFTPEQTLLLFTSKCYDPNRWDFYWMIEPCKFVMDRLEDKSDIVFGTPRLVSAWRSAVLAHPLAYLRHRATFMWTFLTGANLVVPVWDLDHPRRAVHVQNPFFMGMVAVHNALQPTMLLRMGFWLIATLAVCAFAWKVRSTPSGSFAFGVAGSAAIYVMTYFIVGVASDFRYGYWSVLATLTGAVAVLAARRDAASADALPSA